MITPGIHITPGITPPGPRGPAVLGTLIGLKRNPLRVLYQATLRYGSVVRFPLAHRTFYLVTEPDHVQYVLQDHAHNFTKRTRTYRKLSSLVGNGLLTSEGDDWYRQRMMIQPVFHRSHIACLDGVVTDLTLEMLQDWFGYFKRDQPFDLTRSMTRLTLAVVGRALLGTEHPGRTRAIEQTIGEVVTGISRRIESMVDFGTFIPTPASRRLARSQSTLNALVDAIIAERKSHPVDRVDILSRLVSMNSSSRELTEDELIRDQIMTFLMAGHETTASALSWIFYLLAQNPECGERLSAELKDRLDGETPTYQHLQELSYTHQVVLEALRLYPPVWLIERHTESDDLLGGFEIPAGTTLALSQYVTHRHPDYWNHPGTFIPDRFEALHNRDRHRYAYFPFGGAARHCIGDSFAMMEMQLILATVWQHYHVRLLPDHTVRMRAGVTLRPQNGLWIRLVKP